MSAWLSFFGGYAQGASEQIDEQRKREEQFIQDRMKMAAATRLEKQKEAEKQRKELEEADVTLSALPGYASANPAQKIALLASPVIRKQYIDRVSAGENVNLDDLMTVDPKLAEKYPTVKDYITQFQAKPKTVDTQTQEAFNKPRQLFGATVGSGQEQLAQNAARFGMKPEEALGWEQGGEDLPSLNVGATLKQGALAPTDIDGQLKLLESEALKAQQNGDAEAMSKVTSKVAGLQSLKKMLEGGEEAVNYQRKLDMVQWQIITAKTPEDKRRLEALKVEMERVKDLGTQKPKGEGEGNTPTYATLKGAADSAGTRAVMAQFGDAVKSGGIAIITDANGNQSLSFNKLDTDTQAKIRQVYQAAASEVFKPFVRNGVPVNNATRLSMQAVGIGEDYFTKQLRSQQIAREQSGGSPRIQQPAQPQQQPASNIGAMIDNVSIPAPPTVATKSSPGGGKTITRAEIKARAEKYGLTAAEVEADAKSLGYTIK